ncbi:MAG: hypothetical protein WCS89_04530 [Candidatus Paceibacterota bacterium]
MKKSSLVTLVVLIVVIVGIIWFGRSSSTPSTSDTSTNPAGEVSGNNVVVPVTETTKVSAKTSKYENAELGFAVNYPTAWEASDTNTGVTFIMPIDSTQVSTVNRLQADISIVSAKCAFPPVTTIKDRGTIKVAGITVNMISMSNTVQGRSYFNRMYSLQQGSICYSFSFASVALSPESKGLTGSNITQAQNNNKAITATADTEFTNMVKSFVFVQGPAGQDESKVAPVKK